MFLLGVRGLPGKYTAMQYAKWRHYWLDFFPHSPCMPRNEMPRSECSECMSALVDNNAKEFSSVVV